MSTSSFTSNGIYILGAGLLFLVLSSKNILIYNEELLILLSFIAFVATSAHTMGDSIAETFQSRRDLIQEELQAFFTTKETMLHELKQQTILQTELANSMIALGSLVQKELQTLHAQRDMTVKNTVQTHTMAQLQQMMAGEQASYARVHTMTSAAYKFMMIEAYHMDKENMDAQFMQNALHLLKKMHDKKMQARELDDLLASQSDDAPLPPPYYDAPLPAPRGGYWVAPIWERRPDVPEAFCDAPSPSDDFCGDDFCGDDYCGPWPDDLNPEDDDIWPGDFDDLDPDDLDDLDPGAPSPNA